MISSALTWQVYLAILFSDWFLLCSIGSLGGLIWTLLGWLWPWLWFRLSIVLKVLRRSLMKVDWFPFEFQDKSGLTLMFWLWLQALYLLHGQTFLRRLQIGQVKFSFLVSGQKIWLFFWLKLNYSTLSSIIFRYWMSERSSILIFFMECNYVSKINLISFGLELLRNMIFHKIYLIKEKWVSVNAYKVVSIMKIKRILVWRSKLNQMPSHLRKIRPYTWRIRIMWKMLITRRGRFVSKLIVIRLRIVQKKEINLRKI